MRFPHSYFFTCRKQTVFSLSHLIRHLKNSKIRCNVSHLLCPRPSKVKDLPDSVCPVFLDKMEGANLSSLPRRAPSRFALTQRAVLCLANVRTRLQMGGKRKSRHKGVSVRC